jgi:hypothetical protein
MVPDDHANRLPLLRSGPYTICAAFPVPPATQLIPDRDKRPTRQSPSASNHRRSQLTRNAYAKAQKQNPRAFVASRLQEVPPGLILKDPMPGHPVEVIAVQPQFVPLDAHSPMLHGELAED